MNNIYPKITQRILSQGMKGVEYLFTYSVITVYRSAFFIFYLTSIYLREN